jgi:hypothetical protein
MVVRRFPVEAGHILTFARAIGDPNPAYTDLDHAVAPPTFVQASAQFDEAYSLRWSPDRPWFGSAGAPSQSADRSRAQGSGLHAEQHFTYHRPVRAGDVLSAEAVPGATWEREGRRGGTMTFRETITEYRDQDGELVVTARHVGVRTSKVPG